tara:strand:- start:514 stop:690 length:177 start_codon:yes stop_codon:yes gene_type:complete
MEILRQHLESGLKQELKSIKLEQTNYINALILKASKTCVGTKGTSEERIEKTKKFYFG